MAENVLRRLRESHEERLLATLRTDGALSRAELGRRTGLSRATLYAIVHHLLATDRVVEQPTTARGRGRGRPARQVTLNPAGGLALGLDLGHQRIHAAIANVAHEVVATGSETCAERTPPAKRLELALALVDRVAAEHGLSLTALAGVGVGVIGPVADAGQPDLASRFDVPVTVDNNARLAALAEATWGNGAGVPTVVYLRLSHGVGGGLVLGGQLHAGATGGAGELGHVTVDPDGPPCHCGGRGCLERYVSIAAILDQCRATRLADVLDRLRSGDPPTRDVVVTAGVRIGRVLAAACNLVNPDAVVLGGELAAAGDHLLDPVRQAIDAFTHRQVRNGLRVGAAALGDDAAARGGIAAVLRRGRRP